MFPGFTGNPRLKSMAHRAVPGVVYGQQLYRLRHSGENGGGGGIGAAGVTESRDSKSASVGSRSLWCCFCLIMPVAMPILVYVKDNDLSRRLFLGVFVFLLIAILVCFSLAVFHTRTRQIIIARRDSDDDRITVYRRARPDRSVDSPHRASTSSRRTMTPQVHQVQTALPVAIQEEVRVVIEEDPPPYHVALGFPLPGVHRAMNIREELETPPPAYDKSMV